MQHQELLKAPAAKPPTAQSLAESAGTNKQDCRRMQRTVEPTSLNIVKVHEAPSVAQCTNILMSARSPNTVGDAVHRNVLQSAPQWTRQTSLPVLPRTRTLFRKGQTQNHATLWLARSPAMRRTPECHGSAAQFQQRFQTCVFPVNADMPPHFLWKKSLQPDMSRSAVVVCGHSSFCHESPPLFLNSLVLLVSPSSKRWCTWFPRHLTTSCRMGDTLANSRGSPRKF